MRIIFMGTPDFAVPCLQALHESEHTLLALVTQPDRPKGRGGKLTPPATKVFAQEHGIPVFQPPRMKDPTFLDELKGLNPDLIAVTAFGRILPPVILDLPPKGCVNVHASLLPKYRGAAPINWAIINGETETGITTMQMDPGMDTGDMLLVEKFPIGPEDTAGMVFDELSEIGARLLMKTIAGIGEGTLEAIPQDNEKATMAPLMEKETGKIDWTQPAQAISNRVRGLDPWPGAFTFYKGERLRIWKAAVDDESGSGEAGTVVRVDKEAIVAASGQGLLKITEIQPANGKRMAVRQFLAGRNIDEGERFGE